MSATALSFFAPGGMPEVRPGDDLGGLILAALNADGFKLAEGDVVIVCQKIVSKSENRFVALSALTPSPRAQALAAETGKDARFIEAVLQESSAIVRTGPNLLITRHRLGFVMANAGIDQSNIGGDGEQVLLLPEAPDESAKALRAALHRERGIETAVLITDSFGRPWRLGVTGVCIGCAGLIALVDERGRRDRFDRELRVTQTAIGDALAAGAMLLAGEADEGRPVVIARGVAKKYLTDGAGAGALVRPAELDLFL